LKALVDGFGRLFRQVFMAPGGASCVRVVEKGNTCISPAPGFAWHKNTNAQILHKTAILV
jgi:hypothetical protein